MQMDTGPHEEGPELTLTVFSAIVCRNRTLSFVEIERWRAPTMPAEEHLLDPLLRRAQTRSSQSNVDDSRDRASSEHGFEVVLWRVAAPTQSGGGLADNISISKDRLANNKRQALSGMHSQIARGREPGFILSN
jgi:hypothetical protein